MNPSRNTTQKIKILEYLKSVHTHPTAEQVFLKVKKDLPALTLATVYRNLNQMTEQGQIVRLELNKEFHFDGDMRSHQHCVCNSCGKIDDLFQEKISQYALQEIKDNRFQPVSVTVMFYGICDTCQ